MQTEEEYQAELILYAIVEETGVGHSIDEDEVTE